MPWECVPLEQVGTEALCAFKTLLQFPFLYQPFVAGKEYFGHFPAFVFGRTGIDGCCQEVVLEGI
jgi:hypothetical protein